MSDGKRTEQPAAKRLALAVMLLGLGGCLASHDRDILASWYLVDKVPPQPAPGEAPGTGEIAAEVDDIYLTLVNRGSKERRLYGLFMNGQELHHSQALSRPIAPGEVLILPTGIFDSDPSDPTLTCRLPVRLAVRTKDKKSQRPRPIRLIGTMPGALPSEWLDNCRRNR